MEHSLNRVSKRGTCTSGAFVKMVLPPIGWGLFIIGLVSVLYEPLRLALWTLGDEVGGVGGVGGLTNQFSPSATGCNATGTGDDIDTEVPYCFHEGWMGFTYFGGIMLLAFTLPLGIGAISAYTAALAKKNDNMKDGEAPPATSGDSTIFFMFWLGASSLWFFVPLAYYTASDFYQKDIWHMILAVSIASAYPLSWHLCFVAIPSAGMSLLAPLLALEPATLKECHVRIAWATLFWAGVHAIGEIIYMASQSQLYLFKIKAPSGGSDNLIFIFGLSTFCVLSTQSIHAYARRHESMAPTFRKIHRVLAVLFLLIAAAHWWPFAIFLAPAVACAATAYAIDSVKQRKSDVSVEVNARHSPPRAMIDDAASLALFAAIGATLLGVSIVWSARQAWMLRHPSDYYSFMVQIFPPAAIILAFALARGAATAVLCLSSSRGHVETIAVSTAVNEAPLLTEEVQIGQDPEW